MNGRVVSTTSPSTTPQTIANQLITQARFFFFPEIPPAFVPPTPTPSPIATPALSNFTSPSSPPHPQSHLPGWQPHSSRQVVTLHIYLKFHSLVYLTTSIDHDLDFSTHQIAIVVILGFGLPIASLPIDPACPVAPLPPPYSLLSLYLIRCNTPSPGYSSSGALLDTLPPTPPPTPAPTPTPDPTPTKPSASTALPPKNFIPPNTLSPTLTAALSNSHWVTPPPEPVAIPIHDSRAEEVAEAVDVDRAEVEAVWECVLPNEPTLSEFGALGDEDVAEDDERRREEVDLVDVPGRARPRSVVGDDEEVPTLGEAYTSKRLLRVNTGLGNA
ncbi:hypothetical protein BJ165DRAFT_1403573 [Panaeolus papilionaceus]|nr:hypothetical protein BJ165DRAFT_1403573 [Panaeolus papilionaceus]